MFDLATEQNRTNRVHQYQKKKKKLKKSREQNKQRPTVRATATVRGWIVGPARSEERRVGKECW